MKKILLFALFLSFASHGFAAPSLPALTIQPGSVTVSGISSGAFAAVQMQVALSARIHGVASIAGGIYWCAEGSTVKAQIQCMLNPSSIAPAHYIEKARTDAQQGLIDPLENLQSSRVFLLQSKSDQVVHPEAAEKLRDFFSAFLAAEKIQLEYTEQMAHGFPTLDYGNACNQQGSPWLQNCGYDGAGKILSALYPGLSQPQAAAVSDHLHSFDQTPFISGAASAMDTEGFLYIPAACEGGKTACRLHIALHGCQMNREFTQDQFPVHSGYNRWAEANNIIVLYPMAVKAQGNPNACWDWYGFTGADYAQKSGKQNAAIEKILDQLHAQ